MTTGKTNILFIIVDQMRQDALGQATPNLNALIKGGVSFRNCYCASPLSSPSRNSIVTGLFPGGHGVCGNMGDIVAEPLRQDCYPNHLRSAGYRTAYVGKHHYIDRYGLGVDLTDDDELVRSFGYDDVWQIGDVAEEKHNADRFTKELQSQGLLEEWRANVSAEYIANLKPEQTTDGYIGSRAAGYLREACTQNHPFLLTVGFVGPHGPHWSPEPWCNMYDPEQVAEPIDIAGKVKTGSSLYDTADLATHCAQDTPEIIHNFKTQRAAALGQVSFIDSMIGDLMEILRATGKRDDTLVVFTSDHGNLLGDHGLAGKRFFYESSVTVPLVISGAAAVRTDKRAEYHVRKELVSGVDLYTTFLDVAGIEVPEGGHGREGMSLLRLLDGSTEPRDTVFSELGTAIMARNAQWKLVFDAEQGGVVALYNLIADPLETENLAGRPQYHHVSGNMVERLLSRLIRRTHYTHAKERMNLQSVRV